MRSTRPALTSDTQAGSNTVSLFSINPKLPTDITPIGDPVSSEGEFPMSLSFNSNGTRLCVLNGGAVASVKSVASNVRYEFPTLTYPPSAASP